jgi:hypothetical protein
MYEEDPGDEVVVSIVKLTFFGVFALYSLNM